jgi:hypothetical protein
MLVAAPAAHRAGPEESAGVARPGGEPLRAREALDPRRYRRADRVDLGISTWLGAPAAELPMIVLSPAEDLAIGPSGTGEATPGLHLDGIPDDQAAGRGAAEMGVGPQLAVGALAPAVHGAAPQPQAGVVGAPLQLDDVALDGGVGGDAGRGCRGRRPRRRRRLGRWATVDVALLDEMVGPVEGTACRAVAGEPPSPSPIAAIAMPGTAAITAIEMAARSLWRLDQESTREERRCRFARELVGGLLTGVPAWRSSPSVRAGSPILLGGDLGAGGRQLGPERPPPAYPR